MGKAVYDETLDGRVRRLEERVEQYQTDIAEVKAQNAYLRRLLGALGDLLARAEDQDWSPSRRDRLTMLS